MIEIAYKKEYDPEEGQLIYVTGKEYYEKTKRWARESNRFNTNEPYNHFTEITDIMHRLGYCEVSESIWYFPSDNISTLIRQLTDRGFTMVPVSQIAY